MKKHIHTVHEAHKHYKCQSCGKSFSVASSLKLHSHEVHEGRKDNKCGSCGKSFSRAEYLKGHISAVQFMKAAKIKNVNYVVTNHFLKQEI